MNINTNRLRRQLLAGLATAAVLPASFAQSKKATAVAAPAPAWPTNPVRIIVGFPAGSSPDMLARLLTEPLAKAFGQPFVIENKPGAGGNIGVDLVAKATDEHTLGVNINGPLTSAKQLYSKLPFDPVRDLRPISLIASSPLLLVGAANLPANTLPELMVYAKAQGDKLNYGSVGAGSGAHLAMELFKSQSGITPVHIPYPGYAQVITAMIGKQVDLGFMVPSAAVAQAKAGRVKLFAVSTGSRSTLLPELPTVAEGAGLSNSLPKFDAAVWNGIFAPASMPEATARRIAEEIAKIVRTPDIRQRLFDQGWQALGTAPEGLALRMQADTALWGGVIAKTGTKLD
jgi:tripartite-type tricarboxylate transporter receptor subunit TctC